MFLFPFDASISLRFSAVRTVGKVCIFLILTHCFNKLLSENGCDNLSKNNK